MLTPRQPHDPPASQRSAISRGQEGSLTPKPEVDADQDDAASPRKAHDESVIREMPEYFRLGSTLRFKN